MRGEEGWSIARLVPIERLPADWHFASCKPEVIQCQWPAVVEYFFSCPVSASAFNSGHNSGRNISIFCQRGKTSYRNSFKLQIYVLRIMVKNIDEFPISFHVLYFFEREKMIEIATWEKILKRRRRKRRRKSCFKI